MTQPDYQVHLLEVRKAWRIIAAYQQRIIYLIDEIEDAFPELVRAGWWPSFYARPPAATTRLSAKWTWDGLPYYCFETWFTLPERDLNDLVRIDDLFVVARIVSDTGFDPEKTSAASSFNGPDPTQMPDASQVASILKLNAYRVENIAQSRRKPWTIWNEDDDSEAAIGKWEKLSGARRILWEKPLAELFEEGGTHAFLSEVRTSLGLPAVED